MKKKLMIFIYILTSIPILLFFLYSLNIVTRNIKEHYCLQNEYILFYDNSKAVTLSQSGRGAIRGKIEKFHEYKEYLVGYLTVTNSIFAQAELMGYEKDGYFIFNLDNRKYQFGLNEEQYNLEVKKLLDIDPKIIKYKSLPMYSMSCLFN